MIPNAWRRTIRTQGPCRHVKQPPRKRVRRGDLLVRRGQALALLACLGATPSRALEAAATAPHGLDVVLDYCAAVRGIINSSQGGPLRPPGLRMSEALGEVRKSLKRNLRLKKGGTRKRCWND